MFSVYYLLKPFLPPSLETDSASYVKRLFQQLLEKNEQGRFFEVFEIFTGLEREEIYKLGTDETLGLFVHALTKNRFVTFIVTMGELSNG